MDEKQGVFFTPFRLYLPAMPLKKQSRYTSRHILCPICSGSLVVDGSENLPEAGQGTITLCDEGPRINH